MLAIVVPAPTADVPVMLTLEPARTHKHRSARHEGSPRRSTQLCTLRSIYSPRRLRRRQCDSGGGSAASGSALECPRTGQVVHLNLGEEHLPRATAARARDLDDRDLAVHDRALLPHEDARGLTAAAAADRLGRVLRGRGPAMRSHARDGTNALSFSSHFSLCLWLCLCLWGGVSLSRAQAKTDRPSHRGRPRATHVVQGGAACAGRR